MSLALYEALMSHDITLIKQQSDYTGSLTDVESFEEKGFVEYTQKRMAGTEGEQVVTRAIVYLKADTSYDETHPHWDIAHGGQRMEQAAVDRIDDPRTGKTHHYEIGLL